MHPTLLAAYRGGLHKLRFHLSGSNNARLAGLLPKTIFSRTICTQHMDWLLSTCMLCGRIEHVVLVLLKCGPLIPFKRVAGHRRHSTLIAKTYIPCVRPPALYETSGPLALSFAVVHALHPSCPQPWSRRRRPRPCRLLRRCAPSCPPLPRCLRARRWPHDECITRVG